MSIPDQVQRLLHESDTLLGQGRDHVRVQRQLHAQRQQDVSLLNAQVTALVGDDPRAALHGAAADGLYAAHRRQMARARIMLSHHDQQVQQYDAWLNEFDALYQHYRPLILGALGFIPGPIWDFLAERVAIPMLAEVLIYGDGVMPDLQAIWDGLEEEAVSFLENMGSDFLHNVGSWFGQNWWTGMGDFGMTGGSSGPNARAAHRQISGALATPSNHLTNYASAAQGISKKAQASANSGYCQDSPPANVPPYPAHTVHSRADLTQRAQRIAAILQNGDQNGTAQAIMPLLSDLSPSDIQALENLYPQALNPTTREPVNRNLVDDLMSWLAPDQRYLVFQMLAPQNVTNQPYLNNIQSGAPHLTANPPLAVIAPGQTMNYAIWPPNGKGGDVINVVAYPDQQAQKNGEPPILSNPPAADYMNHPKFTFNQPGTYTIVVEIRPTGDGLPPKYITYTQTVGDPAQMAQQQLTQLVYQEAMQFGGPLLPSAYLTQLNAGQAQKVRDKLTSGGVNLDDCVQIPAVLVPTTGDAQGSAPLALFAKPMPDGSWQIIDVTNPDDPRVYQGSDVNKPNTLDGAWADFTQNNVWPQGQLAAAPPTLPSWYPPSANFSWQNIYNQKNDTGGGIAGWVSKLSLGSIALAGLGIVLAAVGLEPFAGLAFIGAGVAGGASAGLDIYDRVQHQDFAWDMRTWLDIGQIVLSGTMIADGAVEAAPLLKGINGRFTLKLTFKQAVQFGGRVVAAGSTVVITGVANWPYIQTIMSIWGDPSLNLQQKLQKIWATLQDAKDHGGIQSLAMAAGAAFPLAGDARTALDGLLKGDNVAFSDLLDQNGQIKSDLLNSDGTFNAAGEALLKKLAIGSDVDPGLVQAVASDTRLQSVLKNMNGDFATFKQWYQDYLAKIDAGQLTAAETSFGSFVTNPLYASDDPNVGKVGDVTGANAFSRYQRYRIQPILKDPAKYASAATRSSPNWNEFLQKLQTDPQMQMALANALDNGYTLDDLARFYDTWKTGKGLNGKPLPADQAANFYSYIAQGPHIVSDVNTPPDVVGDRIPSFDSLTTPRSRALALIGVSKPGLVIEYNRLAAEAAAGTLTDSEKALYNALNDALSQSEGTLSVVSSGTTFTDATGPFYKRFDEVLGRDLAKNCSIKDFNLILSEIPANSANNAVRGSLGEWYYYYLVDDSPAGGALQRQVEFFTDDGTKVRADFYSQPPAGTGRTLDIKTGYTDGAIDPDQIENYSTLIKEGKIAGNDYLFMPDGENDPAVAAGKAFATIRADGLLGEMHVYYLDGNGNLIQVTDADKDGNVTQTMNLGNPASIITPAQ